MTADRWDHLPDNWAVKVEPLDHDPRPVHPKHPLASQGGLHALQQIMAAEAAWRNLTKPQRELLLSTVAGCPIAARRDVIDRVEARGLIERPMPSKVPDWWRATDAGRAVVAWRL